MAVTGWTPGLAEDERKCMSKAGEQLRNKEVKVYRWERLYFRGRKACILETKDHYAVISILSKE